MLVSSHSDVASGLSDGNEGVTGGRHEGRPAKRHQRRSVRSRSRNEKTSKVKLNVLNVSPAPYLLYILECGEKKDIKRNISWCFVFFVRSPAWVTELQSVN